MYDIMNNNNNEGIIYPSVKKNQVITLSTTVVDDASILSKQSETSMSITPNKEVFRFFSQTRIVDKVTKTIQRISRKQRNVTILFS